MIETPEFLFAAPPKAGCRWTHGALAEVYGRENLVHGSFHMVDQGRRDKPWLSIVRDPADWARSYFQNINFPVGMPELDAFLDVSRGTREPDAAGFRRFVAQYIAAGLSIGHMFAAYHADHVLRIEDMPGALERLVGRPIRYRERWKTRGRIEAGPEIRALIYEHEREFCQQWGYGHDE